LETLLALPGILAKTPNKLKRYIVVVIPKRKFARSQYYRTLCGAGVVFDAETGGAQNGAPSSHLS